MVPGDVGEPGDVCGIRPAAIDRYRNNNSLKFEGSAGYLVSKRLLIGAEYRAKPDNLTGLREDDWVDVFAAYAINKHLSITAAYADLGQIATFKNQHGLYISLQAGF